MRPVYAVSPGQFPRGSGPARTPVRRPPGRPPPNGGSPARDAGGVRTRINTMSTTQIAPETSDTRTDEGDDHSHYARREEIVRASIEGGRVTALCGYKFEPVRDPSRFPICPKCKELVEMAQQFG